MASRCRIRAEMRSASFLVASRASDRIDYFDGRRTLRSLAYVFMMCMATDRSHNRGRIFEYAKDRLWLQSKWDQITSFRSARTYC